MNSLKNFLKILKWMIKGLIGVNYHLLIHNLIAINKKNFMKYRIKSKYLRIYHCQDMTNNLKLLN